MLFILPQMHLEKTETIKYGISTGIINLPLQKNKKRPAILVSRLFNLDFLYYTEYYCAIKTIIIDYCL
jgi:hypothetical protein